MFHHNLSHQKGMSLLEVLIAVLILSIGLLGVGATMFVSQTSMDSSYLRQQAIQEAISITERMRANQNQAQLGSYNLSMNDTPQQSALTLCTNQNCSPNQLALMDKNLFLQEVENNLPNGKASISTTNLAGGSVQATVTLSWTSRQAHDNQAAQSLSKTVKVSKQTQTFTLKTIL